MFKINKVKNYRQLAEELEKQTGCSVKIKVLEKSHIHYEIYDKYEMILGTLCVNDGDVSFAPFVKSENATDNEYINIAHMVQADDFIKLLGVFNEMFVEGTDEDVQC